MYPPIFHIFFDGNIVDDSGQFFIHYKGKSFKTYKLLGSLLLEEIKFPTNNNETYDDVTINIDDYFQKSLTKNNIPCMYLFLNHNDVFNVALSSSKKIYDDIFRSTNNMFIGFSASFNIFNLSLFTHTFFNVLDLFDECFTLLNVGSKKIDANFVAKKLMDIYINKETLCKLYDLAVYKKEILTMTNKNNNRELFLNKKFGCVESLNNNSIDQQKKESLIVEYENHEYDNYDEKYNKIIQKLTQIFINIATELYVFSKMLNIPDYKYMFLFSVLSYRLKNKYITGGMCFSVKKTLDQLEKYATGEYLFESKKEHIKYFKPHTQFPTIYEYISVKYKNKTYGNCMENVIFQFLKLFFWNNGTYNLENVKNIIKPEYYDNLRSFFLKIKNERASDFIQEWVKFIMFENKNVDYDLLQHDVEINPTKKNLFIALREIFALDVDYGDDKIDMFFHHLLDAINATIEIVSSLDEDKLILHFSNNQTLTIMLMHHQHAYFNEAVDETSDSSLNIINQIGNKTNMRTIHDDLVKNKYYSISLNQWILLQIVFSNILNVSDVQKRYIQYITKNFNNEIILLLKSVINDSMRDIREEILINLVKSDMFFPIIWKYVFKYVKFDIFWKNIAANEQYLDKWDMTDFENNTPWHHAVQNIKSEFFWEYIMTKDKYLDTWDTLDSDGESVWFYAMVYIKSEFFWKHIMTNDKYFNKWGITIRHAYEYYTLWHHAVQNIQSEFFWEYIMTKDKYLDTWDTLNSDGKAVWFYAMAHIKSEFFWEHIMTNDNYFNKWGITTGRAYNHCTLWHDAVYYIKFDIFWEYIMTKDKYLDTWDTLDYQDTTVWYYAVKHIKSNMFWGYIMTKDKYLDTWVKRGFLNKSVWYLAVEYIKFDKFWEYIMTKDKYLDTWGDRLHYSEETVWERAKKYIKSDIFWQNIKTNKKYMVGGFYKHKFEKYKLKEKKLLDIILHNGTV